MKEFVDALARWASALPETDIRLEINPAGGFALVQWIKNPRSHEIERRIIGLFETEEGLAKFLGLGKPEPKTFVKKTGKSQRE